MSVNEKLLGLKVTPTEYERLKQIAGYLHNQTLYDVKSGKHRRILQTNEPAELVKLAINHFMARYMIPDSYLVAFNLGAEDYKYYKDYAIHFNNYETNNIKTNQRTKVLQSQEISELAWVSMNTYIAQMSMMEQLQTGDGNFMDKIAEVGKALGIDVNNFAEQIQKRQG